MKKKTPWNAERPFSKTYQKIVKNRRIYIYKVQLVCFSVFLNSSKKKKKKEKKEK